MLLNCGAGEDSWESLALQGDQTIQSKRKSTLNIHWKDWCWSWSSNPLATWCELSHWKRPWCWERLKVEGDDKGWDGWMVSPTQWTWVWVNSGSWWWTGRPGVLRSMGSRRVGHDWATDLNYKTVTLCWLGGRGGSRSRKVDLKEEDVKKPKTPLLPELHNSILDEIQKNTFENKRQISLHTVFDYSKT